MSCPRPINPLVMLRTPGLAGGMLQRVGLSTCLQGPGMKHGLGKPPVVSNSYAYSTPATGSAPAAGQILHPDDELAYLYISGTDNGATDIMDQWLKLRKGDTITFNGADYVVVDLLPVNYGTYVKVHVDNTTQQSDATYAVTVTR